MARVTKTAEGRSGFEPTVAAALFAMTWAAAALFHVAGDTRQTSDPAIVISQVLVAGLAVAVLASPRRRAPLLALAVAVPLSAWFEAPVVGNHWVLAALISVALLLALRRAGDGSPLTDREWAGFAPAARLTVAIAYGFAAFAKLNTAFFDPDVSCAVFYHDQLFGSWGLSALTTDRLPALAAALPAIAAGIEVLVAVGLVVRPLRRWTLPFAFGFHWLLALDLHQHFWDFSSVLFALFVLFLGDESMGRLTGSLSAAAVRRPGLARLGRVAAVSAGVVVAVLAAVPGITATVVSVLIGHVAWWIYGTGLSVAAIVAVRRGAGARLHLRPRAAWLFLVPVLAFANGLTPYLELKTGFGWNMYSNLRTVAGESNHLLVPATLDLTGAQRDLVEVVDVTDDELRDAAADGYAVVPSELAEYAATRDVSGTIRRGGVLDEADPLSSSDLLPEPGGVIAQRLQSFRLVDTSGTERCLTAFTSGR